MSHQKSKSSGSEAAMDDISHMWETIGNLKKDTFTVGGKKLFAISPGKMESLERRIDRALAQQGESNASPSELVACHAEIAKLRSMLDESSKLKKSLEEEIAKSVVDVKTAREAKTRASNEAQRVRDSSKEDISKLKDQLKSAEADLEASKVAIRSAQKSNDVAGASVLAEAKAEAVKEVASLKSSLMGLNAKLKLANDAKLKADQDLAKTEDVLNAIKGQHTQLKNALLKADSDKEKGALTLSAAIEKLLGKEACMILAKWNDLAYDDVKERAFVARQALARHKNGLISGVGKLFNKVWEWCKAKSYKARVVLKPWMDMVISDLASAKLKTVAFYRDELAKIIEEFKAVKKQHQEKARTQGKPKPEESKFSDLWFYGQAILNRINRRTKGVFGKAFAWLKPVGRTCKIAWRWVKLSCRAFAIQFKTGMEGHKEGWPFEERVAVANERVAQMWREQGDGSPEKSKSRGKRPVDQEPIVMFDAEAPEALPLP